MNYYSEQDIRDIVASVLAQSGTAKGPGGCADPLPVEISARHVHLTEDAVEKLYGTGCRLTRKRDLSQPGEFLSGERVKIVTAKGVIDNVAVLGPVRQRVQVELSLTDARTLGIQIPVNLSGDLTGAGDVLLVGPAGILEAKGSAIAAKAHIHMTPADAGRYGVRNGQSVSVRLQTSRPVTLEAVVVRVKDTFRLAVHIDFDEANAAAAGGEITGILAESRCSIE